MQGLFLQGFKKDLNSKYCYLFFKYCLDSASGMVPYVLEAKTSPVV